MQLTLGGRDALFIHVPKTGGNTVQQALLAAGCSSDQLIIAGHQDGRDRFELRGPHTFSKHQALAVYAQHWPPAAHCSLFACIRPPLQRLLSLYFSPHRWYLLDPATGTYHLPLEAPFDPDAFAVLVASVASAADALGIGEPGSQSAPGLSALLDSGRLTLLRTAHLLADFKRAFGWPLAIEPRNVSPWRDQARSLAASAELQSLVDASHHALDQLLLEHLPN